MRPFVLSPQKLRRKMSVNAKKERMLQKSFQGVSLISLLLLLSSFFQKSIQSFPMDNMSSLLTQRSSTNKATTSTSSIVSLDKRKNMHTRSSPSSSTSISSSSFSTSSPMMLFYSTPLYQSSLIFAFINGIGLFISILSGSHIHLDLLGTGAFALAVLIPTFLTIPMLQSNTRIVLSSLCVAIWSMKLAFFLFYRALQVKTDARLDDTLHTLSGTIGFWIISFLWGIICSLPHTLGSTSISSIGNIYLKSIGVILFLLGFITETRSDYQKWMFKLQQPNGRTSPCTIGLWSISQHPNFFGNLLLWLGILIMNGDSLIECGRGRLWNPNKTLPLSTRLPSSVSTILSLIWKARRLFLALLSPCFMYLLFHGQASGYITNSVQLAIQKYGGKPNGLFEKYIQETPLIFPRDIVGWLYQTLKF